MAAFHQLTQRLAVGTSAGVVIIYDLRTATKWRILQGHEGSIAAVAFAAGGELVASYSAADCTLRWWQAGSSSLLGYFGLHGHCHKVLRVELPADDESRADGDGDGAAAAPSGGAVPPTTRALNLRLEWTSTSTVMLLGRMGKPLGFYTL
jgi:WD40 repeat protein